MDSDVVRFLLWQGCWPTEDDKTSLTLRLWKCFFPFHDTESLVSLGSKQFAGKWVWEMALPRIARLWRLLNLVFYKMTS